jgi:hypothetical protein
MSAPKLTPLQAEQRADLVDEFGRLDAILSPHRPQIRRFDELAKALREWHAGLNPEATFIAAGTEYEVFLSAKGLQTHFVAMLDIFKALGRKKFLAACGITLKGLQENVDAAGVAALTFKERTGTRELLIRRIEESVRAVAE